MIVKQMPLAFNAPSKTNIRTQFAAVCYRLLHDKTEVLLIKSRRTRRWIVPKGWPTPGLTPAAAAAREAWEEAGVVGDEDDRGLGIFSYEKLLDDGDVLPCVVMVYPIKVKSLARRYPEVGERKRRWFSPKKAAERVAEPELAAILHAFDPRVLV